MIKENKYISLPLAKELQKVAKENKFQLPESEYAWDTKRNRIFKIDDLIISSIKVKFCFAYDCSELGEILPDYFKNKKQGFFNLTITKNGKDWFVEYKNDFGYKFKGKYFNVYDSLADTLCKMWIYLIKNKLI